MAEGDHIEYRRFVPAEAELRAEFLTTEDWPYHGPRAPDAAQVCEQSHASSLSGGVQLARSEEKISCPGPAGGARYM